MNIDVTVYFGGYHGDLNETFYVGTPDEKTRKLVIGAYACLQVLTTPRSRTALCSGDGGWLGGACGPQVKGRGNFSGGDDFVGPFHFSRRWSREGR